MASKSPRWFDWARELYSLAQAGLTYSQNEYDLERYRRMQQISAEMIDHHTHLTVDEVLQSFSMQAGYATPKVDVRAGVICDGKILLVHERADGRWAMPGGWGDMSDSPAEMVAREALEETGLTVRVERLVGVYDISLIHPTEFYRVYKLIFLCSVESGQLTSSYETPEVGFFSMDEIPELSEKRTNRKMLADVFSHYVNPLHPTFFE